MLKLSNIRIPVRIAIACLLPLLAFVAFEAKDVIDVRGELAKDEAIAAVADAVPMVSALVTELQKERAISAVFTSSKGKVPADAMRSQRSQTDRAIDVWNQRAPGLSKTYSGTKFARALNASQSKLANIGSIRAAIDAGSNDAFKLTVDYTAVLSDLLTNVDVIDDLTENGKIISPANALTAMLRRKEYAEQARSYGVIGFTAGQFDFPLYQRFARSLFLGDAAAVAFSHDAAPAQVEYVNRVLEGSAQETMRQMAQVGARAPFAGNTSAVSGPQWFEAALKHIENFKPAEDRIVRDFSGTVQSAIADATRHFWIVLGILFAVLLGTGLLICLIVLSITRPVGQLVVTMATLAQGKSDIEVLGAERGDELGHMARAVLVFRDAAVEKTRLEAAAADQQKASEVERQRNEAAKAAAAAQVKHVVDTLGQGLEQLAKGALTYRITTEFADEYKKVQDDFNEAIAQLQETVGAIMTSVREVSNASGEISTSTTDLSQRTEEQAASLEETSASMEEISATVKKNAENAQQANQFATGTREVCDRGGEVVAEAVKAMSRIEESSRKISDIIGVIDEIARQTNLLALNAAVEAARAGEAGRGFAVVASEVRSLAQRSSQAAKDIKDLIVSSSDQVQEGVELVNRAGTSLSEILASIKKVADIVSDIAAASAEQATGLEQIGKALNQMDEVTQQNSALVEENAATAKTLEHQARAMDERVAFFRIEGDAAAAAPRQAKAQSVATASRPAALKHPPIATPKRAAANGRGGGPVGRMQTALATTIYDDPEWKEF